MTTIVGAKSREHSRLLLIPVGLAALLSVTAGAWAGLARMGLASGSAPIADHGPLMVLGFLGTVVAAERAVGLGRNWAWASPFAAAVAVPVLLWVNKGAGSALMLFAGVILVGVYVAALKISGRQDHLIVMSLGAIAWVIAAATFWARAVVPLIVPALAAYLVLTICGERLELSRMGKRRPRWLGRTLVVSSVATLATASLSTAELEAGSRLTGLALVVVAASSAWGDIARKTIRTQGLTRYMAAALLIGYAWLTLGGLVWAGAGLRPGSPSYDIALHTIFVGFVISMIFAHAPVIVPALGRIQVPYHPSWWGILGLLHLSLVVRVGGDALGSTTLRSWGGIGNVAALGLFFVMVATSALTANHRNRMSPSAPPPMTATTAPPTMTQGDEA